MDLVIQISVISLKTKLCRKGSSLSGAHLLGLAAFVVHLHASSVSRGALVELVPPLLPEPVTVGEALSLSLVCTTRSNMIFCVRCGSELVDLRRTALFFQNLAELLC